MMTFNEWLELKEGIHGTLAGEKGGARKRRRTAREREEIDRARSMGKIHVDPLALKKAKVGAARRRRIRSGEEDA